MARIQKRDGPTGRSSPSARTAGARRTRELSILNAIAEALNSSVQVDEALARTLSLVASLLDLRTGWVWLLDAETGQFYNAAAQNLPPYLQEPVRMTGRKCWCIESFLDGELTPKNIDVLTCSRLLPAVQAQQTDLTQGLGSHASIPLAFQDKPLGIMNVTGPSWRKLTRPELRLLSTIAYQVGIAVERARLADERTRLARAEERARIAREIHDTLAQGLTAIALHIEGALPHLAGDPERARERLEKALAVTRESLEEARRSVLSLRAALPDGRPLAEALGALARAFTSEKGNSRSRPGVSESRAAAELGSRVIAHRAGSVDQRAPARPGPRGGDHVAGHGRAGPPGDPRRWGRVRRRGNRSRPSRPGRHAGAGTSDRGPAPGREWSGTRNADQPGRSPAIGPDNTPTA